MLSTFLEQLGVATARVTQHVDTLAQGLSLCQRVFQESLTEATALNKAQTDMYQMDVGGALFHTQKEGLLWHGGMLAAMVSDDFSPDFDFEYIFLDRDPTWFPLVLHFLRTGVALLPEDTEGLAAVFREAQYYSLEALCRAAQPLHEQIIVIGIRCMWQSSCYHCETYSPLQRSWASVGVGTGFFVDHFRFCAGDGCLFALQLPNAGAGVFKFCPAAGRWQRIANNNPITSRDVA